MPKLARMRPDTANDSTTSLKPEPSLSLSLTLSPLKLERKHTSRRSFPLRVLAFLLSRFPVIAREAVTVPGHCCGVPAVSGHRLTTGSAELEEQS